MTYFIVPSNYYPPVYYVPARSRYYYPQQQIIYPPNPYRFGYNRQPSYSYQPYNGYQFGYNRQPSTNYYGGYQAPNPNYSYQPNNFSPRYGMSGGNNYSQQGNNFGQMRNRQSGNSMGGQGGSMSGQSNSMSSKGSIYSQFKAIDRQLGFDRLKQTNNLEPYQAALQEYKGVRSAEMRQELIIQPFIDAGREFCEEVNRNRDSMIERSLHNGDTGPYNTGGPDED